MFDSKFIFILTFIKEFKFSSHLWLLKTKILQIKHGMRMMKRFPFYSQLVPWEDIFGTAAS